MKKLIPLMIVGLLVLGSAFWIRAQEAALKPGDQLPPLTLTYLADKPDTQQKPLLVEFWATWCPPCRKSIPHLNQVYARYHGQGLQMVGITAEDEQTVKEFERQIPIRYPVAINAPQDLYARFGVDGIPHAFLVDRHGKVVWAGHPLELTDDDLQGALH